jgi:N-acetylmuramoyl-L-alanine amidase
MNRRPVVTIDKRAHQIVPTPEPGVRFDDQSELVLLAQAILGEAEGETYEGKLGVGHVIMNRTRDSRWGNTVQDVVLQKWQFSAFNSGSPRLKVMRQPIKHAGKSIWRDCIAAACSAMFRFTDDPTNGSDHYLVTSIADKTSWAKGREPEVIIGHHSFYSIRW